MAPLTSSSSSVTLHLDYEKSSIRCQSLNTKKCLHTYSRIGRSSVTSTISTISETGPTNDTSIPLTLPLTRTDSGQQSALIPKSLSSANRYSPPPPSSSSSSTSSTRVPSSTDYSTGIHLPSIVIVYLLVLITESARGIIMPTAWPYFHSLGGTKAALGMFVAAHPFGRILSTLPVGFLSDRYSTKSLMCVACCIQICGHLMYAFASNLTVAYCSRAIVGIGAVCTFLGYTHIAKCLAPQQRLYHFAYLSGVQFIGVSVMPVLGGVLSNLPAVDFNLFIFIRLNCNRYPALVLALANLLAAFIVVRFYECPPLSPSPSSSPSPSPSPSYEANRAMNSEISKNVKCYDSIENNSNRTPDMLALIACIAVNFVLRGAIAMLETVAIPLLRQKFELTLSNASMCMSMMGVLGAIAYVSIRFIPGNLPHRWLLLTGMGLVIIGVFPLSFSLTSHLLCLRWYITLLSFAWSLGIPLALTTCLSLFTKLLNGCSVGSFLALFATAGSLSPLVFGIPVSTIWNSFGTEAVFSTVLATTLAVFAFVSYHYHRLGVSIDI